MILIPCEMSNVKCRVCCAIVTQIVSNWIRTECCRCKATYRHDEWRGAIVRKRREILRLDRAAMAALLGVERKAVTYAETRHCSDAYWQASEQAVLNHFEK